MSWRGRTLLAAVAPGQSVEGMLANIRTAVPHLDPEEVAEKMLSADRERARGNPYGMADTIAALLADEERARVESEADQGEGPA